MNDVKTTMLNDRYVIDRILGEGALGRTYLAKDSRTGALVAIKELLPSRMKRWKDFDLFHRECQTLKSLEHPGIPRYFEDFTVSSDSEGPDRLFLVQEFIDGRSLQDLLDEGESFDEERVKDVAKQTLEVLTYLHGLNPPVIHRDIKPANLMLNSQNRIVLIDFGAVREAVTLEGVGSTIVGTFGYMPPEQYAGQSVPGTDLFALGATLVQLLTRTPPGELFEGLHHFRIPEDLPVTLGFERMLLKLTEPEVRERYQKATDVMADLEKHFLMVPKSSITGLLPIPHDILPAPRPFPGFFLRDAYHGWSHLLILIVAIVSVVLVGVFPIALYFSAGVWMAIPGIFAVLIATATASVLTRKARTEINVYRRGTYTLGEVTGVFWSDAASSHTNLTYRYRVGDGFKHGSISTVDKAYTSLSAGDPVGVIYLPEEPEEHVMYAVPTRWAAQQNVLVQTRVSGTGQLN